MECRMGLDVKKLPIPPDAYHPGFFVELFITPMLRSFLTPEVRAATEALMAYLEGDEEPMWALADEQTGLRLVTKPDERIKLKAPLKTMLRTVYLVKGDELVIPHVVRFLAKQADRIEEHARVRRNEDEAAWFLGHSKSYAKQRQALSEYKEPGEKEKEAFRAAFLAEKELPPGEQTTINKIEWRIERDNQPLKLKHQHGLDKLRKAVKAADEAHAATEPDTREHQRTKLALRKAKDLLEQARAPIVFSHERYPLFEDPSALAEFAAEHDKLFLEELVSQAPSLLSEQELEVFKLAAEGLRNNEIAESLGRSKNQIAQEKHRAQVKLRRAAGL